MSLPHSSKVDTDLVKMVKKSFTDMKIGKLEFAEIVQNMFIVTAERGLNEDEFKIILSFIHKGPLSVTNQAQLMQMLIPSSLAPAAEVKIFLAWFFSHYPTLKSKLNVTILQWIVGLLEYGLLDIKLIDLYYYDLFKMAKYTDMLRYVCHLLLKLTKPHCLSYAEIKTMALKYTSCEAHDQKCLLSVLNLFRFFKPHLFENLEVPEKDVNANVVFKHIIPQKMDFFLKLVERKFNHLEQPLQITSHIKVVKKIDMGSINKQCKISKLIPSPSFLVHSPDGSYPASIQEAYRQHRRPTVPDNVLAMLRDEVGFFLLMNEKYEVQNHFSERLLDTLQEVFIYKVKDTNAEDNEYLLSRTFDLQVYLQQGISNVSLFLSSYMLQWDGLKYRSQIMNLLKWVVFDSFPELYSNILRPLYHLFITCDVSMKQQILQTCTHLIMNMFNTDLYRATKNLPNPFMNRFPKWIQDPTSMLQPLVKFVQTLIKAMLTIHEDEPFLLLRCIHFYYVINILECQSNLPMWTVICEEVVGRCMVTIAPVALNKVCQLLLRYHKDYLPHLREHQPRYYAKCADKIQLSSRYCQELINVLWEGKAFTRKEDGQLFRNITEEEMAAALGDWYDPKNIDLAYTIQKHPAFVPFICLEQKKNGRDFFKNKHDHLVVLEFYMEGVAEFISHFHKM